LALHGFRLNTTDIFTLLESVGTIARNGLAFARDPFDRERYEALLALCERQYVELLAMPSEVVRERMRAELGQITPKVGASAAVVADGQILLVRRADDGTWCLPGGWVEPNEAPQETAAREALEETGLVVVPYGLVGVFTRRAGAGHGPHSAVGIVYLCRITDGALGETRASHEITEIAWMTPDEVPAWHELHEEYARAAVRLE
jgi:8-oxo-dGTP pyrophosphatase MutT (NUDIX family)